MDAGFDTGLEAELEAELEAGLEEGFDAMGACAAAQREMASMHAAALFLRRVETVMGSPGTRRISSER
jgi:hypothetical protein